MTTPDTYGDPNTLYGQAVYTSGTVVVVPSTGVKRHMAKVAMNIKGLPDADASVKATLATALSVQLRLFAPFLPFVTEEVWSWWQSGSVHRALWPVADDVTRLASGADGAVLQNAAVVLAAVRKSKSEAKTSMRTEVPTVTVTGPADQIAAVKAAAEDLKAAGRIDSLVLTTSDAGPLTVDVQLADA